MTSKEKYVAQLRELADFYEKAGDDLPRTPVPQNIYSVQPTDIPAILRDCGKIDKKKSGGFMELRRELQHNTLIFNISQEKVCERRVVGQRWVAPTSYAGHFEDQVEWDCKPILSSIPEKEPADGTT